MASIAASNFFSTDDISANEWKTFGKPRLEITKLNKQQKPDSLGEQVCWQRDYFVKSQCAFEKKTTGYMIE